MHIALFSFFIPDAEIPLMFLPEKRTELLRGLFHRGRGTDGMPAIPEGAV
jgi:hypothetical protein